MPLIAHKRARQNRQIKREPVVIDTRVQNVFQTADKELLRTALTENKYPIAWFTMINKGYLQFVKNFTISMKRAGVTWKLVVFCLDAEAYASVKQMAGCIALPYLSNSSKKLSAWATADYKQIVFQKLACMKDMIPVARECGQEVVGYIDTDIWLYSDPTPHIMPLISEVVPCVGQCDERGAACSMPTRCPALCSGAVAFHSSIPLEVFSYTLEDMNKYNGDQDLLKKHLVDMNIPYRTVEKNIFVNGGWPGIYANNLKDRPPTASLMHFNFLVGAGKVNKMRKSGCWYV